MKLSFHSIKVAIAVGSGSLLCCLWLMSCDGELKPVENVDITQCALNSGNACPCDGTIDACDDGSQCINAYDGSGGACLGDCELDPCTAFCAMEIECIPFCPGESTEGPVPCSSAYAVQDCFENCDPWVTNYSDQSSECGDAVVAWMNCVSSAVCDDALEFFNDHPDDVTETTPCAAEFDLVNINCQDFEPLKEYTTDASAEETK